MYYEKEIYTFSKGYIFRYEIYDLGFRKPSRSNQGCKYYVYRLRNVYQQKRETIEPMWYILGLDKICMDQKDIKALIKNYGRKDKYKFIERF